MSNTTGTLNTASGALVLLHNTIGSNNTASGYGALATNTTASNNTAQGFDALVNSTTGHDNTAEGAQALGHDTTGSNNIALGSNAGHNIATGSNNIALGASAGANLSTGNNNIDIGAPGVAGEAGKIHIGKQGTQNGTFIAGIFGVTMTGSPVVVNSSGKLGVSGTSSIRFKEAVKPMEKVSEAILALKPVTFRYREEIDPDGIPQFGLVAEEVEKINRDLITRDDNGKPTAVRYDAVNAMLLNEFLKAHRKVEEQGATIARLESKVAKQELTATQQQKQIEALTAGLQKVNARLDTGKSEPQLVVNNQ